MMMLTPILMLLACQPSLMLENDIQVLEDGVQYPDKKYTLVKEKKNWTEAKTWCKTHYSGLCVIHTERDWNESKAALGNVTDPVWIGLHRNPDNPWHWSNGEQYLYLNWHGGADQCIQFQYDDDYCVFHHSKWFVEDCDKVFRSYVCQKVTHSNGATVKRYIRHYLQLKNHEDAIKACQEQGGDLASITNKKEQEAFDKVCISTWSCWIGLHCSRPIGWSSGEPFPPLEESNTASHCMTMKADGKLEIENCESQKAFLCYGGNLHFHAEKKDWMDALRFCMIHGGSLVHITNSSVQQEVVQLLTHHVLEDGAWIGMERNIFGWESPWEWDWVSGERVDNLHNYTHGDFPADVYSYHCGKIIKESHKHTWLDDCCCHMRPFICQGGDYAV